MNLYPTRAAAIEHEIRKRLSEGLGDLLPDPRADGTCPAIEDYYDVAAIADEVLELFVTDGGTRPPLYCLRPGIYPALFWDIAERHASSAYS